MNYEFERRAVAFLKRIESMPPCISRQQAYESLLAHWHAVESCYLEDKAALDVLLHKKMTPENDWHCLDSDPCYWQSPKTPEMRVYIHDDGAIVIQRLGGARDGGILFALNSATLAFATLPASDSAGLANAAQAGTPVDRRPPPLLSKM